jgi:hypothetical protein
VRRIHADLRGMTGQWRSIGAKGEKEDGDCRPCAAWNPPAARQAQPGREVALISVFQVLS